MQPLKQVPCRRCPSPRYPTRLEVAAAPNLLTRHVPPAWLTRREIAGALGALLIANTSGCSDKPPAGSADDAARAERLSKAAIVAPVFEHGEGRGATGCMVLNPPSFLSEEEALSLIKEELLHNGLQPSETKVEMEGAKIPSRTEVSAEDFVSGNQGELLITVEGQDDPLVLHFKDPHRRVGVTYVGQTNHRPLRQPGSYSSVHRYDLREVAHWVQDNARKSGKGIYLGVFYDPMASPSPPPASQTTSKDPLENELKQFVRTMEWMSSKEYTAARRAESQRLLRQQVKDFVDWLQAQGVI